MVGNRFWRAEGLSKLGGRGKESFVGYSLFFDDRRFHLVVLPS